MDPEDDDDLVGNLEGPGPYWWLDTITSCFVVAAGLAAVGALGTLFGTWP